MTRLPDLDTLTPADKDALIHALWAQVQEIAALRAANAESSRRVADLEARLGAPEKTSDNSSVPPSQGSKLNKPPRGKRRRAGHGAGGRRLHPDPDQRVVATATECPHCRTPLGAADQTPQAVYDKIDLPQPAAMVTRVERHGGTCPRCGGRFVAPVPAGLEPGSPPELVEGRAVDRGPGGLSALPACHRL